MRDTEQPDDDLSAQLTAACETVRRQIDVRRSVRYSRSGGYGGDDNAIRALQAEFDELQQALAGLTPRAD